MYECTNEAGIEVDSNVHGGEGENSFPFQKEMYE